MTNLAGTRWLELRLLRHTKELAQHLDEVEDRRLRACGDVEHISARGIILGGANKSFDDVVDEREVARLKSVAVHDRSISVRKRGNESRNDGSVLR